MRLQKRPLSPEVGTIRTNVIGSSSRHRTSSQELATPATSRVAASTLPIASGSLPAPPMMTAPQIEAVEAQFDLLGPLGEISV